MGLSDVRIKTLLNAGMPKRYLYQSIADFKMLHLNDGFNGLVNKVSYEAYLNYMSGVEDNFKKGVGLFFSGPNGIGKTMLMSISISPCIDWLKQRGGRYRIHFLTAAKLARLLTFDLSDEEKELKRSILSNCDLLLIDDFGKLVISNNKRELFFVEDVLRQRYLDLLPTFVTCQSELIDIKTSYSEGLADVFTENMVEIKFVGKSYRTRDDNAK